jgi:hypothetical protein
MAVTVIVKKVEVVKEKEFPKLMISPKRMIVLFSQNKKGMIVDTGTDPNHRILTYLDYWNMEAFEDYNEPITIQNE